MYSKYAIYTRSSTHTHRGRKSKMINYLVFDFFFHFQKKYKPTPNRTYTPMNIYIGFTTSPKSHAISRLVAVLNYLFLLIYANTTSTANMIMTIMWIGMPNKGYQVEMIRLPISLAINYQVKQLLQQFYVF